MEEIHEAKLDAKIKEIHSFVASTFAHTAAHQRAIRQELDRLYAELAELVPESSPSAVNRQTAGRRPG